MKFKLSVSILTALFTTCGFFNPSSANALTYAEVDNYAEITGYAICIGTTYKYSTKTQVITYAFKRIKDDLPKRKWNQLMDIVDQEGTQVNDYFVNGVVNVVSSKCPRFNKLK